MKGEWGMKSLYSLVIPQCTAPQLYHTRYRNFCSLLLFHVLVESARGSRLSDTIYYLGIRLVHLRVYFACTPECLVIEIYADAVSFI